jgi:hypothetical protein
MMDDTTELTAASIAQQLGETERMPLAQIRRIVEHLGPEAALEFVREAFEIEAQGGMLLRSGRHRTLGGIFFHLVRERASKEDQNFIWPHTRLQSRPPRAVRPPFAWEERLSVVREALQEPGGAITVKITLIGRPGRVVDKGEMVLTAMQSTKVPSLPKGLPQPPAAPTKYLVFISKKHWLKVAGEIQNPEDALIVEGYPVVDPEAKGIAVFALNVTTKHLQAAKRQAQG